LGLHSGVPIALAICVAFRRTLVAESIQEESSPVIYFFAREHEFTHCEIYPGAPHILILITPDGVQHTEEHESSDRLHARWGEVVEQLTDQGWQGPFGRDTRS
jgi:hypothetical protein